MAHTEESSWILSYMRYLQRPDSMPDDSPVIRGKQIAAQKSSAHASKTAVLIRGGAYINQR